jgi:hypothetical protein
MDNRTQLDQHARDVPTPVVLIPGDREAARRLLGAWLQNDDPADLADQHATFAELKQALDEDRLSFRKLFP